MVCGPITCSSLKTTLEEEGLPTDSDFEKITVNILPTITDLSEKKLKYIRVKDGTNFKRDVIVDAVLSERVASCFNGLVS